MHEEISRIIENIKTNPRIVMFDEASTKQFVILPLLHSLGWNTHSIDEIRPEFPIENKKVDYSLHVNGKLFFLEVKRIGEELERHEKQLLEYSFLRGVEFAILTNGIHWCFYFPMKRCEWQARKFASLDLRQQETPLVVQKLIDILSKENAITLRNAEELFRTKSITESLPVAWNKLISQADLGLLERLSKITQETCGYHPKPDEVSLFIKEYAYGLLIPLEEKKRAVKRYKQETHSIRPSLKMTLNIANLLDAIAAEYLNQANHTPHSDNDTVYTHSDYPLQLTVRNSPTSDENQKQIQFERLEFLANSQQIVRAFGQYCATHNIQNAYISAPVFAAKLRSEKEQLIKHHWEIVSKSSIFPYFKKVSGGRYWKFVKTG